MVDDVYSMGFKLAVLIAEKLGISNKSYNRYTARIFHILNQYAYEKIPYIFSNYR